MWNKKSKKITRILDNQQMEILPTFETILLYTYAWDVSVITAKCR